MPLYVCNCVRGAIAEEAKPKIAADITEAHCDVTGAPARFVHAVFFEEADRFPLMGNTAGVYGTIRAGRTQQQIDEIAMRIRQSMSAHAGIALDETGSMMVETPASWVMEGGDVMPEPGEEAEWLAKHGVQP